MSENPAKGLNGLYDFITDCHTSHEESSRNTEDFKQSLEIKQTFFSGAVTDVGTGGYATGKVAVKNTGNKSLSNIQVTIIINDTSDTFVAALVDQNGGPLPNGSGYIVLKFGNLAPEEESPSQSYWWKVEKPALVPDGNNPFEVTFTAVPYYEVDFSDNKDVFKDKCTVTIKHDHSHMLR